MQVNTETDVEKRYIKICIFFILVLAASLRLYHIGFHRIWYDEVRSIATAEKDIFSHSNFYLYFSYKPLYFLILKSWIYFLGSGAVKLRLLSAAFGVISVFLMYKVGSVVGSRYLGLISSFLLSISCFHVYHSQQIRQFTFITLLGLSSYYFFLKIIASPRGRFFVYNVICNIALIFTHPYGLTVVIAQMFSSLLVFGIKRGKIWFLYNIATCLSAGVWFFLSNKVYMLRNTWWIRKPGLQSIIETVHTFIYGGPRYGLDDFWINYSPIAVSILSLMFLLLIILGSIRLAVSNRKAFYSLWLWLIVPIGMSWFFSLVFFPVFAVKHLIVSLPPFLVFAANGLLYLRKRIYVFSALFLVLLLIMPSFVILYTRDYSIAWDKAVIYLKKHIKLHSIVVIAPLCQLNSFIYYFREGGENSLKDIDTYGKVENGKLVQYFKEGSHCIIGIDQTQNRPKSFFLNRALAKLRQVLPHSEGSVWLLIDRWMGDWEKKAIIALLLSHKSLIFRKTFQGIELYKFADLPKEEQYSWQK